MKVDTDLAAQDAKKLYEVSSLVQACTYALVMALTFSRFCPVISWRKRLFLVIVNFYEPPTQTFFNFANLYAGLISFSK